MADRQLAARVGAIALVFLALVYLPDVGHGFLKDDFAWVAGAARLDSQPWRTFLADASGTFYRPIVTLSFAVDHAVYGLRPFGYAITNLVVLVACAAAIVAIARSLGLSLLAATTAAGVWLMNPHGINMAVLWLSGRTSLLMTLLACGGVWAMMRGWTFAGLLFLLGAMLSKEDALLVPAIVLAALWAAGVPRRRSVVAGALMALTIGVYFALRLQSHALTPATAPSFYRLSWDPSLIAANALGYLDRSVTAFAALLLVACAIYGLVPRLSSAHRRVLILASVWFAAGIFITVRVPVRSSLYAVFPSVGAALAFATCLDGLRAGTSRRNGDRLLAGALLAVMLAFPVYRSRNARWVLAADVSRDAVTAIAAERDRLTMPGLITLEDEPVRFANLQDAFGEAAPDAVRLLLGPAFDARIVPRGDRSTAALEVARFVLTGGRVIAAPPSR